MTIFNVVYCAVKYYDTIRGKYVTLVIWLYLLICLTNYYTVLDTIVIHNMLINIRVKKRFFDKTYVCVFTRRRNFMFHKIDIQRTTCSGNKCRYLICHENAEYNALNTWSRNILNITLFPRKVCNIIMLRLVVFSRSRVP